MTALAAALVLPASLALGGCSGTPATEASTGLASTDGTETGATAGDTTSGSSSGATPDTSASGGDTTSGTSGGSGSGGSASGGSGGSGSGGTATAGSGTGSDKPGGNVSGTAGNPVCPKGGESEHEPNNTLEKANVLVPTVCGHVSPDDPIDVLSFRLNNATQSMFIGFGGQVSLRVLVGDREFTITPNDSPKIPFTKNIDYYIEVKSIDGAAQPYSVTINES